MNQTTAPERIEPCRRVTVFAHGRANVGCILPAGHPEEKCIVPAVCSSCGGTGRMGYVEVAIEPPTPAKIVTKPVDVIIPPVVTKG